MAAVTGHIEGQHDVEELVPLASPAQRTALDGAALEVSAKAAGHGATKLKSTETAHVGLVRMSWFRSALYNEIVKREIDIIRTRRDDAPYGGLTFTLTPGLDSDTVPWNPTSGGEERGSFVLFSTNKKMACPTWDLPAGVAAIGGSCPGASGGQAIDPPNGSKLPIAGRPPRVLERAICNACYAVGGGYERFEAQAAELVRMLWTGYWLEHDRALWISTMVDAVKLLIEEKRWWAHVRHDLLPVRLHSSGDFFSMPYASAWVEVINAVRDWQVSRNRKKSTGERRLVRFWAPSRTWAAGAAWQVFWADTYGIKPPPALDGGSQRSSSSAVKLEYPDSLIVRPSAFHFDDPTPEPGAVGSPYAGSTSIYKDKLKALASYSDWTCPVYAEGVGSRSCEVAKGPDGEDGCRVCWMEPHLRVNYVAH